MLKKGILWVLVILTCVMIFNFSSKKGSNSYQQSEIITKKVENIVKKVTNTKSTKVDFEEFHKIVRKEAHFVEFALLGIFSFLLVRCYNFSFKKSLLITLLFVLFYACTDEIHQLFIDGRTGCVKDVLIDFFGGVTGIALLLPKELRKQTKKL